MLIKDIKHFKQMQDKAKKDYYNFSTVIKVLMNGDNTLGIKPDYKAALKLLHHWEKRNDDILKNKTLVYIYLYTIYEKLGKKKEYIQYRMLYLKENLYDHNNKIDKYNFTYYIDILLEIAFDNNKLVDKKALNTAVESLLLLFKEMPKNTFLSFKNDTSLKLTDVFYRDLYGHKHLYLAHYFSVLTYIPKNEYVKDFSKEDVEEYLNLLDKLDSSSHKSIYEYLKAYIDYKYKKKDDKSKCIYAYTYYCKSNPFIKPDYEKGMSILMEAYNNGYKEAAKYIYEINKNSKKECIEFLSNHIKKYKNDNEYKIILADLYFEQSLILDNITDKKAFNKAIKLYEENKELLNDNQLEKLAHFYTEGIGVEADLDKASALSKSTKANQAILEKKRKLFDSLVIKDKSFNDQVNDLKSYIATDNFDKQYELYLMLNSHYILEQNIELEFKLANIIYESTNNPDSTVPLANSYLMGNGVEKDISKFIEYINIGLEKNGHHSYNLYYIYNNLFNDGEKALEALNKSIELGSTVALCNKAYLYRNAKFVDIDYDKAFECLNLAHSKNNKTSLYQLGIHYYNGFGVDKDLDKAYDYFLESANKTNYPYACYMVYEIIKESNYKKAKKEFAFKYLLRAANNNHIAAISDTVEAYMNGIGVAINVSKAYEYALKGMEKEDAYCINVIADFYYNGNDKLKIKIDYNKALELYQEAQSKGSTYAIYMIGNCYDKLKDYNKAFKYYQEAYDNGYLKAATMLGKCYEDGKGVASDKLKGFELIKEGSKSKDSFSLYVLARRYLYGVEGVVELDYKKAIKLLIEANKISPDEDNILLDLAIAYYKNKDFEQALDYYEKTIKINPKSEIALNNLGHFYEQGLIVDKDLNKALDYYKKAMDLDYEKSFINAIYLLKDKKCNVYNIDKALEYANNLIKIYPKSEEGIGLLADIYIWNKKDYKKAYELLSKINRTKTITTLLYGDLFYNGYYVPKDYDEAFKQYSLANEIADNAAVQHRLGRCYYFGHGVNEDKKKAYDYIYQAIQDDYEPAKEFYEEFLKK